MRHVHTLTAALVVAGALASGVALAQGPRGGGPGARGGFGLVLGGLDLTEAQRQQVQEVRERHAEQGRETAARLAEARRALEAAVGAVPPNESAIVAMTEPLVQAQIDAALHEARVFGEVWAILTPEQQAQVSERRTAQQARFAERGERRRGRPQP